MAPETAPQGPADAAHDVIQLIRSVLKRSKRYWPVALVGVALGVAAFMVLPRFFPPVYRSEVVMMISEGLRAETVLGTADPERESARARNARLEALVRARPNLQALVEQENISPGSVARLGMADVVDDIAMQVNVNAGEGSTFVVQFDDPDPRLAQRAAHRLGEMLVAQVGRDAIERAAATRKFLEDEEAKQAEELRSREFEYAAFVTAHPEFALEGMPGQGPAHVPRQGRNVGFESTTGDTSSALARQADRLRRRLDQIRNPEAAPAHAAQMPVPEPQLTPESRDAIANATAAVQRAQQELEAREAKYTPRHPDVVAAQSRLSLARERLARVKAAAQALAAPPRPATALPAPPVQPETEQSLAKQLRTVEAALGARGTGKENKVKSDDGSAQTVVSLEAQWAALVRAVDTARDRHDSVQRRLFQAILVDSAQTTGGGSRVTMVQDAYYPKRPLRRGPVRTGAVGLVTMVGLGMLIALGLGFLDPRIVCEWDLTRLGIAPIAIMVPRLPPARLAKRRRHPG
ncbi:MAG: hypothetical protein JW940_24525 [Polyangiaceae bacterium]|nr:hypothetical protein [Polyangiaceae bacterium]